MKVMNLKSMAMAVLMGMTTLTSYAGNKMNQKKNQKMETLKLTVEWNKTFPQSDKVNHNKVTFTNRYGITLAADMYAPKSVTGNNKELMIIPNANHVDLYDNLQVISFDKIENFFADNLK